MITLRIEIACTDEAGLSPMSKKSRAAILKDTLLPTYSVMPLELVAPPDEQGLRILSAQVKSSNTEQAIAINDMALKSRINLLAISVFHALGARDYGRIDIRLDKTGTPQFLEANLLPSLTSGYGSFPKACLLNLGLDYEPMILHIVQLALARRAAPPDHRNFAGTITTPLFRPQLQT